MEIVNHGFAVLGFMPILLFLLAVSVASTFAEFKSIGWITLSFALFFAIGLALNVNGVLEIKDVLSLQIAAGVNVCVAMFNFRKKPLKNKSALFVVFASILGLSHGLNTVLTRFIHGFSTEFLATYWGKVVLSLGGFGFSILALMALFSLLLSAFSLAKRDMILIVSGSILGISLLALLGSF